MQTGDISSSSTVSSGVTTIAGCAEVLVVVHIGMVTIGGRLAVGMTQDALKGRVVARVDVAVGTRKSAVSAGTDRESIIVVPSAGCPVRCRMTGYASRRETGRRMGWVVRGIIGGFVTGIAVGRRAAGIAIGVTRRAGDSYVSAGKRESCCGMIKGRWRPGGRVVAGRTSVTEVVCHVIRVSRAGKRDLVAAITEGWRSTGITVGMT